jgi:hypothetical protein
MSKNDGGAVMTVSREPRPVPEIPRGSMHPRTRPLPGADRLTFDMVVDGFVLTYHDAMVISDGAQTAVQVFVAPGDVVTWDRL